MSSIIAGTGSYLPEKIVKNADFLHYEFLDNQGQRLNKSNQAIIEKMEAITGIKERRYAGDNQDTIDIAEIAARRAAQSTGNSVDKIDGIIVAHNLGNLVAGRSQPQLIPNLAAQIKHRLGIRNHHCVAYDILFGCPGWVEALIQAHRLIQLGEADNVLTIGVDVLSRCLDPHDMDVMLFGDGAGAVILQKSNGKNGTGILFHNTYSDCGDELNYIYMGRTNDPAENDFRLKMMGKNVYKYAVGILPDLVTECLEKVNLKYSDVSKFLFHQANEKMNIAIGTKLANLHHYEFDENKFPMTIQCLGNSSVATVPTLLDIIMKGELPSHQISGGDVVVFASVGAGMHANCVVYKF